MTRTDWLMLFQVIASMLQFINAGLATMNKPLATLIIGGVLSGVQMAVQLMGNRAAPKSNGGGKNGDQE